jgi:hypothetical protein
MACCIAIFRGPSNDSYGATGPPSNPKLLLRILPIGDPPGHHQRMKSCRKRLGDSFLRPQVPSPGGVSDQKASNDTLNRPLHSSALRGPRRNHWNVLRDQAGDF